MTAIAALAIILVLMLAELRVSARNERVLRARGAIAPPDPVYPVMRLAYPGTFVIMALEGASAPAPGGSLLILGVTVFVLGKGLKGWAITALGARWTYRVFVIPGQPLVAHGPYRWLRHPNYVAVIAELVGFALVVGARWSAVAAVLFFGELLRRRIHAEEEALGLNR